MKSNKDKNSHKSAQNMEIEIGFPQSVHIGLVQVNELRHYEIFTWLTSLCASAAAGFWVAVATTAPNKVLLSVSIVFTGFTFLSGGVAYYYRRTLNGSKITKVIQIQDLS